MSSSLEDKTDSANGRQVEVVVEFKRPADQAIEGDFENSVYIEYESGGELIVEQLTVTGADYRPFYTQEKQIDLGVVQHDTTKVTRIPVFFHNPNIRCPNATLVGDNVKGVKLRWSDLDGALVGNQRILELITVPQKLSEPNWISGVISLESQQSEFRSSIPIAGLVTPVVSAVGWPYPSEGSGLIDLTVFSPHELSLDDSFELDNPGFSIHRFEGRVIDKMHKYEVQIRVENGGVIENPVKFEISFDRGQFKIESDKLITAWSSTGL